MANSRTLSLDEIQNCSAKPPLRAESPCSTRFRTCSMRLLQLRVPEFPADARLVLKILHSLPAASVVTRSNSRDFTSNLQPPRNNRPSVISRSSLVRSTSNRPYRHEPWPRPFAHPLLCYCVLRTRRAQKGRAHSSPVCKSYSANHDFTHDIARSLSGQIQARIIISTITPNLVRFMLTASPMSPQEHNKANNLFKGRMRAC